MPGFSNFKICNFCGKGEDKVMSMFSAGIYNICDECVCTCYDMIFGQNSGRKKPEDAKNKKKGKAFRLLRPAEIKAVLDQYVVGQDQRRSRCPFLSTTITSAS